MTREKLVRAAQAGDSQAQGALYEQTFQKVYYFALKYLKNQEDALDAVQDSYILAFSSIGNLEKPEAFLSWLYQITANRCKRMLQHRGREADAPNADDEDALDFFESLADPDEKLIPGALLEQAAGRKLLMELIDELPEAQRQCVLLYYFSEQSVAEIAAILECSPGTVKSRLNYARQKIREGILDMEQRDGVRYHGFLPLGLLLAEGLKDAGMLTAPAELWTAISAGTGAATAAAGATGAAATGAAVKTGLLATAKAKVIAAITAAALVVGGAVAVLPRREAPVVFTSAAFEENLRDCLQKPEGELYPADLREITTCFLTDEGFTIRREDIDGAAGQAAPLDSLADLQLLPSLQSLNLVDDVSQLLPTMPELEQLERVMTWEPISSLDFVNKLPNLQILNVQLQPNTPVEAVSGLTNLKALQIIAQEDGTRPLSLDLSLCKALFELRLWTNTEIVLTTDGPLEKLCALDAPASLVRELGEIAPNLEYLHVDAGAEADAVAMPPFAKLRLLQWKSPETMLDASTFAKYPQLELIVSVQAANIPAGVQWDATYDLESPEAVAMRDAYYERYHAEIDP